MQQAALFASNAELIQKLGPDAVLLRAFALPYVDAIAHGIEAIAATAPFRQMQTTRGFTMSVAITNCGSLGWITDRRGYRYSSADPITDLSWPAMPPRFKELACAAAMQAGFPNFVPDACLINRYSVGSRMSLHQDKDEKDYTYPIVSVSLGLPATFLWGGAERSDCAEKIQLRHGDVIVWGGVDRLRFHGVAPIKTTKKVPEQPDMLANHRINLTFRRAG